MAGLLWRQARVKEAVEAMDKWMDRFDAVVIGPGLGRDELVHETVRQASPLLRLSSGFLPS